jgi:hypothetical protein
MMTIIGEEMDSLREIFLLANSGSQVYRGFRQSKVLSDLAVREKEEVLVDEYRARTEKEDRSIDDVVVAYAILAIASFLEYEEGRALFQRLNVSKLQWGEEIKRLYLGKVPTIYIAAHGKAMSLEDDYAASQIDTSYNAVRGKARLERGREDVSSDSSSRGKIDITAIGGEEKK